MTLNKNWRTKNSITLVATFFGTALYIANYAQAEETFSLEFPLPDYTPQNAPISSLVDHHPPLGASTINPATK